MGGDDLGSDDDDYLNISEGDQPNVLLEGTHHEEPADDRKQKKRKLDSGASSSKKKKTPTTPRDLLFEASRNISQQSPTLQFTYLKTCYGHFIGQPPTNIALENIYSNEGMQPDGDDNYATFIKSIVSVKRLKSHSVPKSPLILVLCVSARRSVSILKSLSSLKIPILKLFPKHMSCEGQEQLLSKGKFGLCVGTPGRVRKLWEDGALCLDSIAAVILDGWADGKGFTVCTLRDTSVDLMRFLEDGVGERKELKIGFY